MRGCDIHSHTQPHFIVSYYHPVTIQQFPISSNVYWILFGFYLTNFWSTTYICCGYDSLCHRTKWISRQLIRTSNPILYSFSFLSFFLGILIWAQMPFAVVGTYQQLQCVLSPHTFILTSRLSLIKQNISEQCRSAKKIFLFFSGTKVWHIFNLNITSIATVPMKKQYRFDSHNFNSSLYIEM